MKGRRASMHEVPEREAGTDQWSAELNWCRVTKRIAWFPPAKIETFPSLLPLLACYAERKAKEQAGAVVQWRTRNGHGSGIGNNKSKKVAETRFLRCIVGTGMDSVCCPLPWWPVVSKQKWKKSGKWAYWDDLSFQPNLFQHLTTSKSNFRHFPIYY